jgi:hypothetical protein
VAGTPVGPFYFILWHKIYGSVGGQTGDLASLRRDTAMLHAHMVIFRTFELVIVE